MSARLLVTLPADPAREPVWVRADAAGAIIARGRLAPGERIEPADGERVVAAVPGEDVTIHWGVIDAAANEAQAAAAARFMAADLSAAPSAEQHVAIARGGEPDGERGFAVVESRRMDDWLGRLGAHGLDPDALVPEPLLMPEPAEGATIAVSDGIVCARARKLAFAGDPIIADVILGERARREITVPVRLEVLRIEESDAPLINLRQGAFAKRRAAGAVRGRTKRLALLAAGIVLALLAGTAVTALRYNAAADRVALQIEAEARQALPEAADITDARAQLQTQLAATASGPGGFRTAAAALIEAVRSAPGISLTALRYTSSGRLNVDLSLTPGAAISSLRPELEAQGFAVAEGPVVPTEDGLRAEIEVIPE